MTPAELEFIKDAFSQIIDDLAGNPDWSDAASAVSADLGALERELERKAVEALPNLEQLVSRSNIAGELRNYTDWHTRLVKFAQLVADWQKSQMLKDAVEGKIYLGNDYCTYELIASLVGLPRGTYKDGDKVRIVILKEKE